ncbi:MAG: phage head closure protein [Hyphomonadaceae bacterium]|nr:phage head closure protein [Hyphomonadaceae bacterium]
MIEKLRARITLQSPERVSDDLGGAEISWSDAGEVWAEISPGAGSAGAGYDGALSNASYRVTIRAPSDVRAGWRVLWNERVFRIDAVIAGTDALLELACVEERL